MESGKNNKPTPVFIFGLPRSGTTLLQRILMSHPQIASIAEPWFLLPVVYATKKQGTLTEYSHIGSYIAYQDFINNMPNGRNDYLNALKDFATNIYNAFCKEGQQYFLDKTPRYHLIIPEIFEIFPNAKYIFLYRNPASIYTSIMSTFSNNSFAKMYPFNIDLIDGIRNLSNGSKLIGNKAISINYETLLTDPETTLIQIMNYLNLEFYDNMLFEFNNQNLKGRLGDPTGPFEYNKIENTPIEKWKGSVTSKYRKRVLKRYISNLDDSILKTQGYSKEHIINEIDAIKLESGFNFWPDFISHLKSKLIFHFKLNLVFADGWKWVKNRYLS